MGFKTFSLTEIGASHIKKNKECQDFSRNLGNERCGIIVVCDGHGGDDYVRSSIGSQIGCEVGKKNILNFLQNVKDIDIEELKRKHSQFLYNLEASIISDWVEEVHKDFNKRPFNEKEISCLSEKAKKRYLDENKIESAYGTTFIAVAVTDRFWFGIHIGDGKCVAVNPEGQFKEPIPWDEKCFLNATTSICDADALSSFRHFFSDKLPVAVFIGSDGIDDSFKDPEQLYHFYKTVMYSFATSDFEKATQELKDYLPRLSAKGSGDDVSIAAVLNMDLIGHLEEVKQFDRDKEKARIEENERRQKEEAEKAREAFEAEKRERELKAKFAAESKNTANNQPPQNVQTNQAESNAHSSKECPVIENTQPDTIKSKEDANLNIQSAAASAGSTDLLSPNPVGNDIVSDGVNTVKLTEIPKTTATPDTGIKKENISSNTTSTPTDRQPSTEDTIVKKVNSTGEQTVAATGYSEVQITKVEVVVNTGDDIEDFKSVEYSVTSTMGRQIGPNVIGNSQNSSKNTEGDSKDDISEKLITE